MPSEIEEYISHNFPWLSQTALNLPYWVWIGLPIILVSSLLLGRISAEIIAKIFSTAFTRLRRDHNITDVQNFKGPLSFFLAGLFFSIATGILPLEGGVSRVTSGLSMMLTVCGLGWAVIRIITTTGQRLRAYFIRQGKMGAASLVPLMDKILKVSIIIIAFLFVLQNFGFDVVAIIAALGIGGIAIALASQKSVENVFGGVMISLDQPVRVGDLFKWNGNLGTVEDIGLRSTKIRTLDRTIISIPNAELANIEIENYAARDKIRLLTRIGLRYETSQDQLRAVIAAIRKLLLEHPKVDEDPARVRFVAFNNYSLDIEIFAYIKTSEWGEFLEIQEDIFLSIMGIVKDCGSDFAFPSQTIYFERGSGLPEKNNQERV